MTTYHEFKKRIVYRKNGKTFNKTIRLNNVNEDKFGPVDETIMNAENRVERWLKAQGVKEIYCNRIVHKPMEGAN